MRFGERLRQIRESRKMTQEELAHAVGLQTKAAISKMEKGIVDPNQSTIWKLSVALGVSPSAFFFEENTLSDVEQSIIRHYRENPSFRAGVDSLIAAFNAQKNFGTESSQKQAK